MSFELLLFAHILGFLPLLLFYYKKKVLTAETYLMLPFLWLNAIASLYEFIGTDILKIPCVYWFRLYDFLEFYVFLHFFSKLFVGRYNKLFNFFGILFLLVFLGLFLVWSDTNNLKTDSYLNTIKTVFVFTFTFLWFRDIFSNLELKTLWESPIFYVIAGMLIYCSGTLFLFILSDLIFKNKALIFSNFWMLNILLGTVLYFFLIIGVWKGQVKNTINCLK